MIERAMCWYGLDMGGFQGLDKFAVIADRDTQPFYVFCAPKHPSAGPKLSVIVIDLI
jgi:hypothetical protein